MKKLLFIIPCTVISLHASTNNQKPTLDELVNSRVARISFEIFRDEQNVNMEAWQQVVVALNDLIGKCTGSVSDEDGNNKLFQEVYRTIEYVRDTRRVGTPQGINGVLIVSVGQPQQDMLPTILPAVLDDAPALAQPAS